MAFGKVDPVILLFTGQTGSTYFVSSLIKQGMNFHREPFGVRKDLMNSKENSIKFLESLSAELRPESEDKIALSTKLPMIPLDFDELEDILVRGNYKVLFMTRNNRIKHTVSLYHKINLRQNKPMPPVDLPTFARFLDLRTRMESECLYFARRLSLSLPLFVVSYEEILHSNDLMVDRVVKWALGEDYTPPQSSLFPGLKAKEKEKKTSDDLQKAVANFAQLAQAYENTPYRDCFYADNCTAVFYMGEPKERVGSNDLCKGQLHWAYEYCKRLEM